MAAGPTCATVDCPLPSCLHLVSVAFAVGPQGSCLQAAAGGQASLLLVIGFVVFSPEPCGAECRAVATHDPAGEGGRGAPPLLQRLLHSTPLGYFVGSSLSYPFNPLTLIVMGVTSLLGYVLLIRSIEFLEASLSFTSRITSLHRTT